MFAKEVILLLTIITILECYGEFVIPEVTLEAYSPKGFRASIPALPGIHNYAFHANVNKEISQVEPGDYNNDSIEPEGNIFTYYNPDLELKPGDVVYYWIFIQYQKLGYRKDRSNWTVTELVKLGDTPCRSSATIARGKTRICKDDLIFEDNFNGPKIDISKWNIEQYIPTYRSLDYEFVSYQDRPDVCYLSDDKLYIKPKAAENLSELHGELDLRGRCTKNTDDECYHKRESYLILPPVTSGRIVSKFTFKYGKVEIKAKLPAGDWIFPEMYLQDVNNPEKKLWIGYARGNDQLLGNSQNEIGGKVLFGGPVLTSDEQDRNQFLKKKTDDKPYTSQMHTYIVLWEKDMISVQVDGDTYGKINAQNFGIGDNDMYQIVLGVGVGGVNDFPDDSKSGNNVKPWKNNHHKQVKNFFEAKDKWLSTWRVATDNRAMQIDYVKIFAI